MCIRDSVESIFDISIAAYLLNPLQNTYDYDDIAREYLGMNVPAFDEIFPKTKKSETPSDEIPENILKYACYNACLLYTSLLHSLNYFTVAGGAFNLHAVSQQTYNC